MGKQDVPKASIVILILNRHFICNLQINKDLTRKLVLYLPLGCRLAIFTSIKRPDPEEIFQNIMAIGAGDPPTDIGCLYIH